MDKKIRKIEKGVKHSEKELKELEKMDKKRDKFVDAGKKNEKRKMPVKSHLENLIDISDALSDCIGDLISDHAVKRGYLKLGQLDQDVTNKIDELQYFLDQDVTNKIDELKYFNGFNAKKNQKSLIQ